MKKTGYLALVLLVSSTSAMAVDPGAVVGGAIGGATGAAIGSKDQPAQAAPVQAVSRDEENDRHEHHDNGRHLGEYKNKHNNSHKHDD